MNPEPLLQLNEEQIMQIKIFNKNISSEESKFKAGYVT